MLEPVKIPTPIKELYRNRAVNDLLKAKLYLKAFSKTEFVELSASSGVDLRKEMLVYIAELKKSIAK